MALECVCPAVRTLDEVESTVVLVALWAQRCFELNNNCMHANMLRFTRSFANNHSTQSTAEHNGNVGSKSETKALDE